jgi:hypothetical protein
MMTVKQEGLARLRAAYPEWTFEEDGETISAKLDGKHIALWLRIAWKAKVVAWPSAEKLHPALASFVFSSPDEVRCMMRALEGAAWAAANFHPGGFRAEDRAPSPPAPVVDEAPDAEDAPDDGLAHDDWEMPPSLDDVAQVRDLVREAAGALLYDLGKDEASHVAWVRELLAMRAGERGVVMTHLAHRQRLELVERYEAAAAARHEQAMAAQERIAVALERVAAALEGGAA